MQNLTHFVSQVGLVQREYFLLPNKFSNVLVDGNPSNISVSTYLGVLNVDVTYGSSGEGILLKGKGWMNLIIESFGDYLMFLHLIKCEGEDLYITGYDIHGLEITRVSNQFGKRCILVMSDLPSKAQKVSHEYVRHCLFDSENHKTKLIIDDMEWDVNVSFTIDPKSGSLVGAAFTGWTWDFFYTYHNLVGGECIILENSAPGFINFQIVDPEDMKL